MLPTFVIATIFLAICIGLIFKFGSSKLGYFHPIVILLVLSVFDVLIPVLCWSISGIPDPPPWKMELDVGYLNTSLSYYAAFYFLMLFPLVGMRFKRVPPTAEINSSRLILFLLLTLILSFAALGYQINSYGGVTDWFWSKVKFRWAGPLTDRNHQGLLGVLLSSLPWRMVFTTLVFCGFYYRNSLKFKFLMKWVFPALAVLLAATTFYRGSILVVVMGLVFIEYLKNRKKLIYSAQNDVFEPRGWRFRHVVLVFVAAVSIFIIYGQIRNQLQAEVWNNSSQRSESILDYAYKVASRGSGINGVTHILMYYSNDSSLLLGRTYLDEFLLPIPRFIYSNKPEWYGITDITKEMGWPISSQEAVTMPGEAFANFGVYGLLVAPLVGFIFLFFFNLNFSSRVETFIFLYPGVGFYVLLIGNWMSFTGIMNQTFNFILCFSILWLCRPRRRVCRAK